MDRNLARSAGCEWQSWEGNLKRQRDLFLCDANAERFWHWGTLLSKDESVFLFDRHAWLTLKFIFEGGDEIRRDKELAHACVCVHAWMRWDSMRSGSLTVRPSADRDLESVCSRSRDISACGVSAVWVWDMCARLRASAIWVLLAGL